MTSQLVTSVASGRSRSCVLEPMHTRPCIGAQCMRSSEHNMLWKFRQSSTPHTLLPTSLPQVHCQPGQGPALLPLQACDPPRHQAREPAAGSPRRTQDRGLWLVRRRGAWTKILWRRGGRRGLRFWGRRSLRRPCRPVVGAAWRRMAGYGVCRQQGDATVQHRHNTPQPLVAAASHHLYT